ncbi:hypothetical protein JC777_00245 (plasmid) [Bacillus cytotoxicus]|uniref:DNA primase/nucleoside triphosphatase C-terminal domain-containing protein n=1 Tax=Bacillus cytotoxicus TaxID=580165 RepID=A0AAX2CNS4_9BACI|nr:MULTISPECIES: primase-like DNA-binding domain-containing protein [Bacillus cereus group]QTR81151.1 hypothetical protein JC777_00245 [Bacillus cytotoxicus]QTR87924.1 hypothetical protein JC774_05230 [Bacillus cytotoxicus]SCM08477.1 Uncharacterized protein BCB44BAC_04612 [Bacillus cytotoxicus]
MERFVEENIKRDIKSFELSDDLYNRYLKYCNKYNLNPISRNSFGHQLSLKRVGVRYKSKNKPARWGVKLLPCKY